MSDNKNENKFGNPTLRSGLFEKAGRATSQSEAMTINGAINKTGILLFLVVLAGAFSWNMGSSMWGHNLVMPTMWGGVIVGFILALVISFKPTTASYLSPVYALCQGLFLGAISAVLNASFPGIALQAIILTVLVATLMLVLYRFRIIKVTKKLASIIMIATMAVAVFYLGSFILSFFGVESPAFIGGSMGSSWLGIGISVVVVVIAAFNLLLDFNFIEEGANYGSPKYMEWYGAFGLTVTLVWLYLEILKLLARLANR